jgi:hypothetical protein
VLRYLLGTSLLQIGYQSAAALLTNASTIAAGTVVLGESDFGGAFGVVRALALAAVTVRAILHCVARTALQRELRSNRRSRCRSDPNSPRVV